MIVNKKNSDSSVRQQDVPVLLAYSVLIRNFSLFFFNSATLQKEVMVIKERKMKLNLLRWT